MSKQDLIDKVAAKADITGKQAAAAVDAVLGGIPELAARSNLVLRGFGSFKVKTRKARTARNPKSGEEVLVPEKRVLTFKPAKA